MMIVIVKATHVSEPRQKMIRSAAVLMRERGVEATSFSEVLALSGAPRGSIYHHFPGGKTELIVEATRYGGRFFTTVLAVDSDDVIGSLDRFVAFWTKTLRETNYLAGCTVAAATLEGKLIPEAREAAGHVFDDWQQLYIDALIKNGLNKGRAKSLAAMIMSAFEGTLILCRAQKSTLPMERTVNELRTVLVSILDGVRRGGRTAASGHRRRSP